MSLFSHSFNGNFAANTSLEEWSGKRENKKTEEGKNMDALKDTKTFGRLTQWPQCLLMVLLMASANSGGIGISLAEEQTAAVEFPVKLPEMDFFKN